MGARNHPQGPGRNFLSWVYHGNAMNKYVEGGPDQIGLRR